MSDGLFRSYTNLSDMIIGIPNSIKVVVWLQSEVNDASRVTFPTHRDLKQVILVCADVWSCLNCPH